MVSKTSIKLYNINILAAKEIHKKVKKWINLYEKIEAVDYGSNEWFQLLLEAGDHEFVCDNVEVVLGRNLLNRELWKLYIEYLEKFEPIYMLQIYSKYCRFFLDDIEMKEKYKAAISTHGGTNLPWENLFDFEKNAEIRYFGRPRRIRLSKSLKRAELKENLVISDADLCVSE